MARTYIGGGLTREQFGKKQFWVYRHGRYDVWVSYSTAVAIVDNREKVVYLGKCARGFSRTTSKQVGQAFGVFAPHYHVCSAESRERAEFDEKHPDLVNKWGDKWDDFQHASFAYWTVAEWAME